MKREVALFFAILYSMTVFAEDTELSFYRPDVTQQSTRAIVAKKSGTCTQQSQLIKREDAWRCTAENKTYDPCFVMASNSQSEAVCADSPWSDKVTLITITTPLDNKSHQPLDMSRTFPWAIELADGEKCKAIEATARYDGLPVHYRCDRNSELFGHVQRCEGMWKMLQHATNGVETAKIAKAWF